MTGSDSRGQRSRSQQAVEVAEASTSKLVIKAHLPVFLVPVPAHQVVMDDWSLNGLLFLLLTYLLTYLYFSFSVILPQELILTIS